MWDHRLLKAVGFEKSLERLLLQSAFLSFFKCWPPPPPPPPPPPKQTQRQHN
jgi:hypothetical protein